MEENNIYDHTLARPLSWISCFECDGFGGRWSSYEYVATISDIEDDTPSCCNWH